MSILRRIANLFHRSKLDHEIEAELRSHIEMRTADNIAAGMSPPQARRDALLRFGNPAAMKESVRAADAHMFLHSVWQDLRYGLRTLRKSPGFTAVAVLTLALGIGANTAIFSVVHAALLRPLPYSHPDALLTLTERRSAEDTLSWVASYPDYLDWVKQSKTFKSLSGFGREQLVFHGAPEPRMIVAGMATTNFFSTLGVAPMLGRDFEAGDDTVVPTDAPVGAKVALLTCGFWKTQYGGDPRIVGRTMQLDSSSVTIIGVLPRDFEFGPAGDAQVWVAMHIGGDLAVRRSLHWMKVIGRLAPNSSAQQARAEMNSITARLRDALVVAEIALSLVLLVGAGLAVKSLGALLQRNPGFDAQNLLTFAVNLPADSYPRDADAVRFDSAFRDRLSHTPGIVGVANNTVIPLSGNGGSIRFLIEGQPMAAGRENECDIRDVSPNYFSVLRIPLRQGRYFGESADSAAAPSHVIVNEAWVKKYLHGENPIGKRIKFTFSPAQPYREIVGVVGDAADASLDSSDDPALFCPFAQDTNSYINYVVRAAGNPTAVLGQVREALRGVDPQLFPIQPLTMEQIIRQSPSVFLRRYPSYLIGSFAALALLLASIGLCGLISYSVSQRTREMGIRIALGARQPDVMRLVLGQGARLTAIGIVIGVAAALGLTQLMGSILYGVKATDPLTFAGVAIALAAVSLLACYVPARRATRVDPMVALRYE